MCTVCSFVVAKAAVVQVEVLSVPDHAHQGRGRKLVHPVHGRIHRRDLRPLAGNRQCNLSYRLRPDNSCRCLRRVSNDESSIYV